MRSIRQLIERVHQKNIPWRARLSSSYDTMSTTAFPRNRPLRIGISFHTQRIILVAARGHYLVQPFLFGTFHSSQHYAVDGALKGLKYR